MLEISAVIVTLTAIILISIPKRIGLFIALLAQILWLSFSIVNDFYFAAGQAVVIFCINSFGIRNWKKKGIA